MRILYLSIVACLAFASQAAAQASPKCPLNGGVKEVEYGKSPETLRQAFGRSRPKLAMPGQPFDPAAEGAQRVISVRNLGNRWAVAYERGGEEPVQKVARFEFDAAGNLSGFPERSATPETLCEVVNRVLGVTPAP